MFGYLTPAGLFLTAFATNWFINSDYPQGDSRNIGGACCMMVTLPAALFYLIPTFKETLRPRGLIILLAAAGTWMLVALFACSLLWAIVRFQLFKHSW
jgi:hypothetical protein